MALLNADAMLKARDRKTIAVPCQEWGGEVLIGEMGALGMAQLYDWLDSKQKFESEEEPGKAPAEEEDDRISIVTTDSPGGQPEYLDEKDDRLPDTEAEQDFDYPKKKKLNLEDNIEFHLRYLIESILDPESYLPAFNLAQLTHLGRKNPKVIKRLFDAAQAFHKQINGTPEAFEKNSPTAADSGGG